MKKCARMKKINLFFPIWAFSQKLFVNESNWTWPTITTAENEKVWKRNFKQEFDFTFKQNVKVYSRSNLDLNPGSYIGWPVHGRRTTLHWYLL